MSVRERYYLSVRSRGVAGWFGLNDAVVVSDPEAEGVVTQECINVWIKLGANRLTARFQPRAKDAGGNAEITIYRADPDSPVPAPLEVLAQLRWPVADPQPDEEAHPAALEKPVLFRDTPATKLWREGEVVQRLSPQDRRDILASVEELRSALVARDADRAYALLQYRFDDESRAEEKDPIRIRAVVVEQFRWMLSLDQLSFAARLGDDEAVLEIVADGQVVHVQRPRSAQAILVRERSRDLSISIPVFAGRIRGRWQIVR